MPQQLQLKTVSVVAIGHFDVRFFTPTALLKSQVLTAPQVEAVEALTAIPGKGVFFESESLKVSAEPTRVQVERLAPPYIQVADILSKALRDNLDSPSAIRALGLNIHAYWLLDNLEVRDRLGRKLAPIDAWGAWSEELKRAAQYGASDPRHPGVASITMRLPIRDDRKAGWIDARVGPSFRSADVPEIVIAINDHYALDGDPDPLALLAVLETRFDACVKRADDITASILKEAK